MKCAICLLVLVAVISAEPPAPNQNYGPPFRANGPPSSEYGVPRNGNSFTGNRYSDNGRNGYKVNGYSNGRGNGYANGNGYNGNGLNRNGNGSPKQQYRVPAPVYGVPNEGEDEYAPASYQFEYAVQDDAYGVDFGHQEAREGDVTTGTYYVVLPDGRKQTVEYTADKEGYKPVISYEDVANGNGYSNGNRNGYSNGNGNGYQY